MDPQRHYPFADPYPFGQTKQATPTEGGGGPGQILYPNGDINKSGWSGSTGIDLWPLIDEVVRDSGDYIQSVQAGGLARFTLTDGVDPGVNTGHIVHLSGYSEFGSGIVDINVYQGPTLIESFIGVMLPASDTILDLPMTPANVANITDYSNLEIEVMRGAVKALVHTITWLNLETP